MVPWMTFHKCSFSAQRGNYPDQQEAVNGLSLASPPERKIICRTNQAPICRSTHSQRNNIMNKRRSFGNIVVLSSLDWSMYLSSLCSADRLFYHLSALDRTSCSFELQRIGNVYRTQSTKRTKCSRFQIETVARFKCRLVSVIEERLCFCRMFVKMTFWSIAR